MENFFIIAGAVLITALLVLLAYWIFEKLGIIDALVGPKEPELLPMPDVNPVFKPRRCEECNAVITGQPIIIVREDKYNEPLLLGGFSGSKEPRLHEAIKCKDCGHQNIIGDYFRPDDIIKETTSEAGDAEKLDS